MEAEQINRLRDEQLLAIEQTNSRINQLENFKKDYEALKDRLKTLPDKVKHDVMVPFGDVAFMPGQLVHTNEILVLLGDNWFVDRSASQAVDIVDRRMKAIDDQIKEMEKQKGLLEPRLKFTSELTDMAEGRGDVTEIREEYDEGKEKMWREQHKKSLQKYHEQLRREAEAEKSERQFNQDKTKKPMTDEELWARLEELELQEQEGKEMEQDISSDNDADESQETETDESSEIENEEFSKKKVRWKDSGIETPRSRRNVITFTHSSVEPASAKNTGRGVEPLQSPGDIYQHFVQHTTPTSILKSPSSEFPDVEPVAKKTSHTVLHTTSDAFTGSIVERPVSHLAQPQVPPAQDIPKTVSAMDEQREPQKVSLFKARQLAHGTEDSKTVQSEHFIPEEEQPAPKRVSKFKAQRQNQR